MTLNANRPCTGSDMDFTIKDSLTIRYIFPSIYSQDCPQNPMIIFLIVPNLARQIESAYKRLAISNAGVFAASGLIYVCLIELAALIRGEGQRM